MIARPAYAGRGDLLRALGRGGETALADMAHLLGYRRETLGREVREAGQRPPGPTAAPEPSAPPRPRDLAPVPFWRPETVEHLGEEPPESQDGGSEETIGLESEGPCEGQPPRADPLVSDARLWGALRRHLASTRPSREVDAVALAELWSRGDPIASIPYRTVSAWTPRMTVLVDRSARLLPFWSDQDRVVRELYRRLGGPGAVREVFFVEEFEHPWWDGRRNLREVPAEAGFPVLALGDLGFLAGGPQRAFWAGVAEGQRAGGALPSALVPCPPERWSGRAARAWSATSWERPRAIPAPGAPLSPAERLDRAERLLGLLAFAVRIEPGLLRAVRRLLPAAEADAGTEADAWNHREIAGRLSPAASPGPDLRRRLEERFLREAEDLRYRAVAVQRAWRAGVPREVWYGEVVGLDAAADLPPGALAPEEVDEAERFMRRLIATAESAGSTPPRLLGVVRAFIRRTILDSLPPEARSASRWRFLLRRAWAALPRREGDPIPPGIDPGPIRPPNPETRRWQVWQTGSRLAFLPLGDRPGAGSLLAEIASANGLVTLEPAGARWARPHVLSSESPSLPEGDLVLRTDRTVIGLRRLTGPRWASAIGRDPHGLWATLPVEGVDQRMRWIPPGRFWMGSPEDEPGRWPDEGPRHVETIRAGFWLGETPCTQALWQAVMGDNPSYFQSPDRPVEQVSWEDCQRFLERLGGNGEDGETWRLPTEAEWEHACRAGTEAATYAGLIEIAGTCNAPILHEIAWYGGNSGLDFELENGVDSSEWPEKQFEHSRAGTHPVGRKLPNSWGLHDMLGNVFEWCDDRWRESYDESPDPGGSSRVIRGGSWNSDAWFVRAAYRSHDGPSDRWSDLGFRLARGQSALQPGAEPGGAERPARGRAERGTRRPALGPRAGEAGE